MLNRRQFLQTGLVAPLVATGRSSASTHQPSPRAEVRQLVTFRFSAGETSNAISLFRDRAIPLYEKASAMRRFRGFREVESPVPLDLIVVSTFQGMAGMDEANAQIGALAKEEQTSLGEIYGAIGALSISHHDQFVEMLPAPDSPKPGASRLTVFESIELQNEDGRGFEHAIRDELAPWEATQKTIVGSEMGRVLVGSGWHYIRFIGIDRLGALHDYLTARDTLSFYQRLKPLIRRTQRIIVATVPELSVR